MNFAQLGLNEAILQSLNENNITQPSEIQEKVIPFILNKKNNLLAISQTGTGKTAAFGLPLLQQLEPQLQQTQLLVLVPTRELGQQVAKDLFKFSRYIVRLHTEAVYGGKKIEEQIEKLLKPKHIIVATPGRLLDLVARKAIDLNYLKFIVLDEADVMLNMGFKPDIDRVLKLCKPHVRKFLFTSTLPNEIKNISKQFLGDDVEEVKIQPQEFVNRNIVHQLIAYEYGYKLEYLKTYLSAHPNERGIIFCRTQAAAKLLSQQLAGFEVKTDCLYGSLSQFERTKVMTAFKDGRIQILIATDIAARGIDVSELNFVIHFHLPDNEAQYVNRSGRTARAGKTGNSIILLQQDELFQKDDFEDTLKIKFEPIQLQVEINKDEIQKTKKFSINLGSKKEHTLQSIKAFLIEETGINEQYITSMDLYRHDTTFVIPVKYESQLIHNLHNTKHYHQKIIIQEMIEKKLDEDLLD